MAFESGKTFLLSLKLCRTLQIAKLTLAEYLLGSDTMVQFGQKCAQDLQELSRKLFVARIFEECITITLITALLYFKVKYET